MLNNSLVKLLVANSHGSLDDLLGNSLLTSINTGNAIATAIVIAMFAYLFVKVNIKFIIRQFTLIVFTIFTPIVAVFWIINKRTIASSIWFGQIVINAFMQFVYTFLFLIYLTFLPKSAGWAVSLLWAMMILPLADALQNTMQNLVSRIAGVDNEALANKGIGMGAAMGQTVKTIAYQFKGENTNTNGGNDFISKVVSRASGGIKAEPIASSSYESYSQNFAEKARPVNQTNINNETKQTQNTTMVGKENNTETPQSTSGFRKAFNVGKEFMNLGMYMAEGRNFKTNESNINNNRIYNRPNINNTRKEDMEESTNKIISIEQMMPMIKNKVKQKVIGFVLMIIKPFIVPIIIIVILLSIACSITDILYIGFNNEDKVDMKKELAYYNTEYKKDEAKNFFESVWEFVEKIFGGGEMTDKTDWPVKRTI